MVGFVLVGQCAKWVVLSCGAGACCVIETAHLCAIGCSSKAPFVGGRACTDDIPILLRHACLRSVCAGKV